MAKEEKPIKKIYVGKTTDLKVGFGKYKDKTLVWVAKNDLEFFKEIETLYYPKYDILKKRNYDQLKIRFLQNNGLATKEELHDKIYEVVGLMKQRIHTEEIYKYLLDKYNFTSSTSTSIITDANSLIRKEFELEKEYLLDIHLVRYENIYHNNINPNLDHVQPGYRKAVLCEYHITALETLFQKEKLLGIHTKKFKLHINSNPNKQQINSDFDMNLLHSNEQIELLSLLNKAKPIESLIRPVIANDNPLDIDSAYKKEEQDVNDSPIQKAKQTDTIGDEEGQILKSTGKTFIEVQQALNKTMAEKVKELYDKKNKK